MAAYSYQALNQNGKNVRGILNGDSEKQIRQLLREQKLTPLEIHLIKSQKKSFKQLSRATSIKIAEVALFTRQLSTLCLAGIPLEESLLSVAEQTEKKSFKEVIMAIRSKVLEGHSLANSMADYPSIFSKLYCASIHAGEQTGKLESVLDHLADYIEKQAAIKQKIQQAMIYPMVMLAVAISIVSFLLIYVVPKIVTVIQDSKQALPFATQLLLAISHFLYEDGIYALVSLIASIWFVRRLLRTNKAFQKKFHFLLLRLPWIRYLVKTVNTARFSRTLGMLTTAGVPIIEALKVATSLINSIPIFEKVNLSTEKISQGTSIAKALKESGYFAPMSIHLIANGEISGQLEKMLEKASEIQENELTRIINTGLTLLEPLIILVMGAIVLFIVLAILLPIFQLDQMTG